MYKKTLPELKNIDFLTFVNTKNAIIFTSKHIKNKDWMKELYLLKFSNQGLLEEFFFVRSVF